MRRNLAISLGLVLITWAAYGRVGWLDFISLDDPHYVAENLHVQKGLTLDDVKWAFTTDAGTNWHPLTWLSLMLDSECFGVRPAGSHPVNAAGYHLVNLALHAASAVTLFLVLSSMTAAAWRSALVAVLFAVHPLHVESVAWVAERKDVLSTLLGFLALAAYVGYVRRPGLLRYALVFVLLALGLLAKPMLVTLPLVLLLLDYWPLGRWPAEKTGQQQRPRKRPPQPFSAPLPRGRTALWLLTEKVPLLVLSAASSAVTYHVQQTGGSVIPFARIPLGWRLENAIVSCVTYVGQMFWPAGLTVFYPLREIPDLGWVLAAAAGLLACSAGAVWGAWRGRRWLAVGWGWYVGMLVPVIGLVQVGDQAHADRYTYLPLVGLFLVVVWGAADLAARWRLSPRITAPAAAALILLLMGLTARQVQYWANTETLFKQSLAVAGDSTLACDAVAAYLIEQGRAREARPYLKRALQIDPGDFVAVNNAAVLMVREKQFDEAARQVKKALLLHPSSAALYNRLATIYMDQGRTKEALRHLQTARGLRPDNLDVLANLAKLYSFQGKLDAAAECWLEFLRLKPGDPAACNNLAPVRMGQGHFADAEDLLHQSLRSDPENLLTRNNLASVEAMLGKYREALAEWSAVLDQDPQDQVALNGLAWVLATSPEASVRDGKKATALAELAVKLSERREPNALAALAAAYAETGQFARAVATTEEAIQLAHRQGSLSFEAKLRSRLELYRRGVPFRDSAPRAATGSTTP